MITRIHIQGYKSLQDVEVMLGPLGVLFGPNAAGKSNFLDALQLLSGIARGRDLKDAFNPPYRGKPLESFTFGPSGLAGLLTQESVSLGIEVDVKLSPVVVQNVERRIQEMKNGKDALHDGKGKPVKQSYVRDTYLRYRIVVEILPKSGILRVADEYLAALNQNGQPSGVRKPFLEQVNNRLVVRMEGQARPTSHDRFQTCSILSRAHYPPHYPHLVAMREEMESWQFYYFEPRERMRASTPVKEVRHIGLMGEDLAAFLNTLSASDAPQFRAIERALHQIVPSVSGIDVTVNPLGEVDLRLREGDMLVPARLLSEGTLRVLGLLALGGMKDPPAVLGFEEPENGIHPRRIRRVAELLRNRAAGGNTQILVTTHSPLLPDMMPNESLLVCRKEGGQTHITPFEAWGPLGRHREIDKFIDREELVGRPVSQRILRGDFDA